MSGENAESEEDKQMEYSTGFCSQHRTSKLRLQHWCVSRCLRNSLDCSRKIWNWWSECSSIYDQNVQQNAHDAEATQSKKFKASKFIPPFSRKVEMIDFEKIVQQKLLLKANSITLED